MKLFSMMLSWCVATERKNLKKLRSKDSGSQKKLPGRIKDGDGKEPGIKDGPGMTIKKIL